MDSGVRGTYFEWIGSNSQDHSHSSGKKKRKMKSKRKVFVSWGSSELTEFLNYIGKDTSVKVSQGDVASLINDYVRRNKLLDPTKKKIILCDEWLQSIFGRKKINRNKIHAMLDSHFADNQSESDDDFLYSSDENEKLVNTFEQENVITAQRKPYQKRKVVETPKSCFASIIPANIQLVYLKRSLVKDLLKDPETFERKLLGSFVRIKSDPNDFLQKCSHQLVQVLGVIKKCGTVDENTDVLLRVSSMVKDVPIHMLSDDNFSEEECEDLHQRIKDGLLDRPTVVELQQKVQMLHADMTKHWLAREIPLLQNLIDRANEKGWRNELDEYLERKQLLQKPDEQQRLLSDVPKIVEEDREKEAFREELSDSGEQVNCDSPRSTLGKTSEMPTSLIEANGAQSIQMHRTREFGASQHNNFHREPEKPPAVAGESCPDAQPAKASDNCPIIESPRPTTPQVIDISDDDTDAAEEPGIESQVVKDDPKSSMWFYLDPQGEQQGPFPLTLFKQWSDNDYFPPDFKVWKQGQKQEDALFLNVILRLMFI